MAWRGTQGFPRVFYVVGRRIAANAAGYLESSRIQISSLASTATSVSNCFPWEIRLRLDAPVSNGLPDGLGRHETPVCCSSPTRSSMGRDRNQDSEPSGDS